MGLAPEEVAEQYGEQEDCQDGEGAGDVEGRAFGGGDEANSVVDAAGDQQVGLGREGARLHRQVVHLQLVHVPHRPHVHDADVPVDRAYPQQLAIS